MKIIHDERCAGYHSAGHPERPSRVIRTVEHLKDATSLPLNWDIPAAVTDECLLRAHEAHHLARLERAEPFDGDTPWHPGIADHARRSVGGALAAMAAARAGEPTFSLMRPPGHHATRDAAMGFCYLNSIAVAALEARAHGVRKVAVFDFDVHHGNGTEDILLNQPGTAFFSIHQFPCYPGTGAAGVGDNCFNFPVAPLTPRKNYREVLMRALDGLRVFEPDLVAVSAGFDAYARDPLAQETLEAEDYHWLGQSFRGMGIPVFGVLEGGYSDDLPELVLAWVSGLSGA